MICLKDSREGTLVSVHAQPGASRSALKGLHGDALKVAVQSRPVEGAANEAIRDLLADVFGLPGSRVTLKSGATSRRKVFLLHGVLSADAAKVLSGANS